MSTVERKLGKERSVNPWLAVLIMGVIAFGLHLLGVLWLAGGRKKH